MKKCSVTSHFLLLLTVLSHQTHPEAGIETAAQLQLNILENLIQDFSSNLQDPKVIEPNLLGRHVLHFLASIRHNQRKMASIMKFLRNTEELQIANEAYMGIQEDVSKLAVETHRTLLYKSGSRRSCLACVMIQDAQMLTKSILRHVKEMLQGTMQAQELSDEDLLKNTTMALKVAIEAANDYGRVAAEFLRPLKKIERSQNE